MKLEGIIPRKLVVVVADTVTGHAGQSVVQPLGRRVAQVAHAVSKVRVEMFKRALSNVIKGMASSVSSKGGILPSIIRMPKLTFQHIMAITLETFEPITTIVLSCRDSKELAHIANLLEKAKIGYEVFYDTDQPDYGDSTYKVPTALCTHPTVGDYLTGITDYLPLLYK